jgi:hypothetical protein
MKTYLGLFMTLGEKRKKEREKGKRGEKEF